MVWLRAKSVIIDPFYSKLPLNLSLLLTLPSTHLSHLVLAISDTPCLLPPPSYVTIQPGTFDLTVPMARLDVLEWLIEKVRPKERLEIRVTGCVGVDRVASVMQAVRCPVVTLSIVLDYEQTLDDEIYA